MARDQTKGNRIGDIRGNNRDGGRRLTRRNRRLSAESDQNVRREPDQLVRERRQTCQITIGIAVHNVNVAAGDIAELLQALRKAAHKA
jgi:hypothetical protein